MKVENVDENAENLTTLRVNAKTFWVQGTKEELTYDIPNFLIAIGGFLGLFIGLSLLDVLRFVMGIFNKH